MPGKVVRKTFIDYLHEFFHDSKSIGIILLACTFISLLLANLDFSAGWSRLFTPESGILHKLHLPHSPVHFINDGLMAIFFFLIGLEIKRELTVGELATLKKALLPVGAAIGGMVVPAFIFIIFNKGTFYQNGWGIPMATDIAFSLGVASMLGNKFPQPLKVFLTALAIIDDLGAIIVIAFFYGGIIKGAWLLGAALCIGLLYLLNFLKISFNAVYVVTGILLWYCVYNSGIHATVAGVLFAFMVPGRNLTGLEHLLHKPVNYIILPLFAMANTAIPLNILLIKQLGSTVAAGIFFGLFFGKPIGIFLACKIMVKQKLARLPAGIKWNNIGAAGILAGIGFTMSIFIASLAYSDPQLQDLSKLTILFSSVFSILFVWAWMWFVKKENSNNDETMTGTHVHQLA